MGTQSNVIPFADEAHMLRRARGAYVKSVIVDEHERSARFVATRIGLSPSSMGERLKGKSPFLADELEDIARVLRIDPVEFYGRYIRVTASPQSDDSNRRDTVPMNVGSDMVRRIPASVAQGIEHQFPVLGVAGSNPAGGANVTRIGVSKRPVIEHDTPAPVVPLRRRSVRDGGAA